MGGGGSKQDVNGIPEKTFDNVKASIMEVMDSPDWDDGSYAPILIRLAWHSAGTYCAKDGTGGSNGATMRFSKEANDPDNAGLEVARKLLEPVKAKHPEISYADLWVLAAYCAIEHTGGPSIPFVGGRKDAEEKAAIAPGRLPNPERGSDASKGVDAEGRVQGWEKNAAHVREVFGRMGLSDREIVALLTGGHVYGRCHNDSSGYAGAWVENPTRFSNEYAADMVGDKWYLVTHDSKMPDGGPVPEEVRPSPGKWQYVDLTKYEPDEEEEEAKKTRTAPPAKDYPPGKYICVSDWVNCREQADTGSSIIGRVVKDQEVNFLEVKVFGTAIRAQMERGGWVSVIASGGKTLFERRGDVDAQALVGTYRARGPMPIFEGAKGQRKANGTVKLEEFSVSQVEVDQDTSVFGKTDKGMVQLFSPTAGLKAEKIVQGYNEKPRKAIKGQTGHQMMLISDMVMLWDPKFKAILEEYAEDQGVLSRDFGKAFKQLTELGCPFAEGFAPTGGCLFNCA